MRVRKIDDSSGKWTVADGDSVRTTIKYVGVDGIESIWRTDYPTEKEAQAALDLYLSKQKPPQGVVAVKETNPKDVLGIKKVPTSTIPTAPMLEIGLAMLEGARKYGRHNYRVVGVRASVYYDAATRHLQAWWEGEDIDPDSGIHHLIKAAACLFVMRDSQHMENWGDDRPPQYPNKLKIADFNEQAEKIIAKYPNCVEPYTEQNRRNRPVPVGMGCTAAPIVILY